MPKVIDTDEYLFARLLAKSASYGTRELGWGALADADLVKVGPKGYVHGWVFVGAPGVNALVHHPKYGHGKVTHLDEHGHAHVDFGGEKHQFEHVAGHGEGHLTPRAKGNDHITAAGAASRAGRHAEAAEHYRQAADEARHPQIASEMRQRAAVSAAKIPDRPGHTPAAGVPGSVERDTLLRHRGHMQTAAGRAAIDEAVRMHDADPGSSISARTRSQIGAHVRASGDKLRRKRSGDRELQAAEGNRLHGLAGLIDREPGSAEPGLRGGPRTEAHHARRTAALSEQSNADAHAAAAEQALRDGNRSAAINHLMAAAGAESDKKKAKEYRQRFQALAAEEMHGTRPTRRPAADAAAPLAPTTPADHVQAIREAYGRAAPRPGAWVPIADLREATPHLTREQQDEAFQTIALAPGHQTTEWDNRKVLNQRDLDAEFQLGGQPQHAMRMDRPDALGLPPGAHVDPFTPIPHVAGAVPEARSKADEQMHGARRARRPAAEVRAERDAARTARDNAKESKRLTQLALGARMRGDHDQANAHLEAAAAVAPDEQTRADLLDARRGTPEHPGPSLADDRARVRRRAAETPVGAESQVAGRAEGVPAGHLQTVRDTYHDLAAQPGDWVSLAGLRPRLAAAGMSRKEQDAALRHLARTDPSVHLIRWDNTKALRQRDHDAALQFGGAPTHVLGITPPSVPGRAPVPRAPRVASSTADIRDALRQATSRAEARNQLAGLTKPQLAQLAHDLGISVRAGKKDQILDALVEGAVGRRLDSEAMSRIGQVR